MACQTFRRTRFKPDTMRRIEQAQEILEDYPGQKLTARQLFYQFVSRDLIDNTPASYKLITSTLTDARYAGLIDWDAIEDRGREPDLRSEWETVDDLVDSALRSFRLPRWADQKYHVELWVEKQALAGVLAPLAREFHVTLMVNKGYCVSPETRILTTDLRWIPANDITVGQEIIGADEKVPGYRKHRKLRPAVVQATRTFTAPRLRVNTDRGSIIVSSNHPFLATRYANPAVNGYYWVEAQDLKPGCRIAYLTDPWTTDTSNEAGWLAGIYDGEGCLPRAEKGHFLAVYQLPGLVSDKIRRLLQTHSWLDSERTAADSGVTTFTTYSANKILPLLGSIRPVRLLATFRKHLEEGAWGAKGKLPATVSSVEEMAPGPVVAIETSTKTLITEGFVSHNSSASAMKDSADRMRAASGFDTDECEERMTEFTELAKRVEDEYAAEETTVDEWKTDDRFVEAQDGFQEWIRENTKETALFYLGDHDPSGEDMVRDIEARLKEFGVKRLTVMKLALTMKQIKQFNPPPNPAKITDSRAKAYIEKFGNKSWELDALPPNELIRIIRSAITSVTDKEKWKEVLAEEERLKDALRKVVKKVK